MNKINREIKSVVITGPTGSIGHALCSRLLREGIVVYAVVRPESKRSTSLPTGVTIIECDISNYTVLASKIGHADSFVHLAWANTFGGGRNDMPSQIANIQYSIDAVSVARELGCRIFIGAGSQAEYGRVSTALSPDTPCFPENGYGMAKLCAGEMTRVECEKYGIEHIWFRILSIYGPYDNPNSLISYAVRSFQNGEKPSLTKCEQMWDYLYSGDAADAFYLALKHGRSGSIYTLGSGICRPLNEYIKTIRDIINSSAEIGFGDKSYPDKQVMYLNADTTDLREDTGWYPLVSFDNGIKETVTYMKNAPQIIGGGVILYDVCIYLSQSVWRYAA